MSFLSESIKSFTPKPSAFAINLLNIKQLGLGMRKKVKGRERAAYILYHTSKMKLVFSLSKTRAKKAVDFCHSYNFTRRNEKISLLEN